MGPSRLMQRDGPNRVAGVTSLEPTDANLAERIADGDVAAFEEFVRRYSDRVHGMAMRMLGDRSDAEDVVQDVFVTVWRRVHEMTDRSAVRMWLFQVVRRHCLIVLRRRRKRRTDPVARVPEHRVAVGAAVAGASGDPQRVAEAGAGVSELGRALADLPARQRDVWLLAEIDGLSYLEIGQRVGAGEQAVRGRLSRARANLADVMRAWR